MIIEKKINELQARKNLDFLTPNGMPIPHTGWSLGYGAINHIIYDIIVSNRKKVVELGSGFSTFFIAGLAKRNPDIEFYSIDSDAIWQGAVRKEIEKADLAENVNFILADIEKISPEKTKKWYSLKTLFEFENINFKIDLLIIDGPSGKIQPNIRDYSVEYFASKLSNNFIVFIDDTTRMDENSIPKMFKENMGKGFVKDFGRYTTFSDKPYLDSVPSFFWKS